MTKITLYGENVLNTDIGTRTPMNDDPLTILEMPLENPEWSHWHGCLKKNPSAQDLWETSTYVVD